MGWFTSFYVLFDDPVGVRNRLQAGDERSVAGTRRDIKAYLMVGKALASRPKVT